MTRRQSKPLSAQQTNTRHERAGHHKISSQVSYLAARLIAEEGIVNVALAIQKAARQMGVTERASLPTELEVQSALKTQQALFQADSQPQECLSLRRTAVEAMRWLDRFSPRLVGSVLDGSANRFSQIELEMVLDDPKQFEVFLLNAGIPFEIHNCRSSPLHRERLQLASPLYELSIDGVAIFITLYPHHAAQFSRSINRPVRARLAEVEALLH